MITVIARLSPEDLPRLRMVTARENTRVKHPECYSKEEFVAEEMDFFRFTGEMIEKYEIDATREWRMSPYTGAIWYDE